MRQGRGKHEEVKRNERRVCKREGMENERGKEEGVGWRVEDENELYK